MVVVSSCRRWWLEMPQKYRRQWHLGESHHHTDQCRAFLQPMRPQPESHPRTRPLLVCHHPTGPCQVVTAAGMWSQLWWTASWVRALVECRQCWRKSRLTTCGWHSQSATELSYLHSVLSTTTPSARTSSTSESPCFRHWCGGNVCPLLHLIQILLNLIARNWTFACRWLSASCSFMLLSLSFSMYTVSQKKLGHFYFYCNFGKCWSILKILLLLESEGSSW